MSTSNDADVIVWHGPDQLRSLLVPIDSLTPDPANARLHPEKNLAAIAGSLRKFGQQKNIVVTRDGVIIAGNGTWEAARRLGWTHLWANVTDLGSAVEHTGFAVTENRSGELAEWDYPVAAGQLGALLDEGWDLGELGWDEGEIANLLTAEWVPPASDESLEGFGNDRDVRRVVFTADQWATVERALVVMRELADDPDGQLGEGRLIELLAADWLAGR